jgi:murein L,D-transpeptidase YafK
MRCIFVCILFVSLSLRCAFAQETPAKALEPLSDTLTAEMTLKMMPVDSPILIRIFKQGSVLEIWKRNVSGQFALLKTYPICAWSGKLGPKKAEGDHQSPEGFYSFSTDWMNPFSKYYLAVNIAYPNAFDRQNNRTGSAIMIHGICRSVGCFAMQNDPMREIYGIIREAFAGGQPLIQTQIFPFKLTQSDLGKQRRSANHLFWSTLKVGYDTFEKTKQPPHVEACGKRYLFDRILPRRATELKCETIY